MRTYAHKTQLIMPALLVLVALRALVPVGYMPAAAGSGLLFELCHDGMPMVFAAPSSPPDGHAHGGQHGNAGGDGAGHISAAGSCALAHILSVAFIDDLALLPAAQVSVPDFDAPDYDSRPLSLLRLVPAPRGPPLV